MNLYRVAQPVHGQHHWNEKSGLQRLYLGHSAVRKVQRGTRRTTPHGFELRIMEGSLLTLQHPNQGEASTILSQAP